MIEKIILEYLSERLTVPVYPELPEELPGRFVVFEKTGSRISDHIRTATLAIQSYGERLSDAMELNEEVKSVMDEADRLPEITRSHLNSDYNFTDTELNRYRYQAVYDIVHY